MRARGADVSYTLPVEFLEAARGAKSGSPSATAERSSDHPGGGHRPPDPAPERAGDVRFDGGPAGDAYVEVHIQPHAYFRRKDNDVHFDLPVGLAEAVLGAKIEVPTSTVPSR